MIFSHVPIMIKLPEVLRYLGYKKRKSETTEEINALIDLMIKKAMYILTPQGIIKNAKITSRNLATLEISCDNGKYVMQGKEVFNHLEDCQYVTLLAVTIGEQIDDEIDQLFQGEEPTKALILDAIGSDAVERVADYVNEYVNKEAGRKGYDTKFRYSPGYGGWSVENQHELLQYLDAAQVSIKATEYSQLLPRKSVSAVIGWYPKKQSCPKLEINKVKITTVSKSNFCIKCGLEDCQYQYEE